MARLTISKLFRQMAFKPTKKGRTRPFKLFMEDIEDRIVPATLPQPTLVTPTYTTASVAAAGDFNPQVVADPQDPTHQVLVAMSATGVVAQTSSDAGQTWLPVFGFGSTRLDPSTGNPANTGVNYVNSSSPSVAFGRDGTLYFVYLTHNADKSTGMVMFQKGTYSTFGSIVTSTVRLYQWSGADPALNPVIAVDNNLPTDPTSGISDTMIDSGTLKSKGIYIAWNGNATPVAQDLIVPNASPIMAVVSGDDGATWSQPTPVSSGGYLSGAGSAAPQIIFSPANSGAPGSLIFVWPQLGGTIRSDASQPDGGVAGDTIRQSYTYIAPILGQGAGGAIFRMPSNRPPRGLRIPLSQRTSR